MTGTGLRVLMVTSEWPSPEYPTAGRFIRQQAEYLRRAGVAVEVFPFRGGGNPLKYLRAWRGLRRAHDPASFELVHAQFGQSGLVAWPAPRPLVVTFRGSDLLGIADARGRYTLAGRALRLASRWIAERAQAVIVVSAHLVQHLPAGVPAHVIPSGLDLDLFRPQPQAEARRQLGFPEDRRLVLFPSNPRNPVKRYSLAEAAVAQLKPRFDVEMVALSGVPHERVPLHLNACDVLVLTSLHEGSPNVVKEALACDLPVVAVDVGDVRERIGGVAGCVVCADDRPETIAAGLAQVLAERRRCAGRQAVADLDERVLTQKVIAVYRSVL